jgi:hypothetical protein
MRKILGNLFLSDPISLQKLLLDDSDARVLLYGRVFVCAISSVFFQRYVGMGEERGGEGEWRRGERKRRRESGGKRAEGRES